MKQYYYFVTSLPKITYFDTRLPIMIEEFLSELHNVIDPKDEVCLKALRYHFDNINFINMLENSNEFVPFGNFSQEILAEDIKDPQHLPDYMKTFLEKKNYDERLHPELSLENELTLYYYNYLLSLPYPFLRKYVKFDFDLKNISTAISSKKYKLDKEKNILRLHELSDNLIDNNTADFGLLHDYEWLNDFLEMFDKANLLEREEKLIEMRFQFVDEELTYDYFSFNQIISFYLKLFLLSRKIKFDEIKGDEIFANVTNDLSKDETIFKDLNN